MGLCLSYVSRYIGKLKENEKDLNYIACFNSTTEQEICKNSICSDNKIHVRFRDYLNSELITCTVNKCIFFLNWLAQDEEVQEYTLSKLSSEEIKNVLKGQYKILIDKHIKTIRETTWFNEILERLRKYLDNPTLNVKFLIKYKPSEPQKDIETIQDVFNRFFGKNNIDSHCVDRVIAHFKVVDDTTDIELSDMNDVVKTHYDSLLKFIKKQHRTLEHTDKKVKSSSVETRYTHLWEE